MSAEVQKETLGFQTEVCQLLDLMVHSLYSNKEIFLRELISNASDAIDKLRFEALGNDALFEGDSELGIHVDYSKQNRTITIRDNGIGMSRQEVIEHIGTIARSGTREFFKSLTGDHRKDAQLIGQFGVGFYSAFIVADRVTLTTRRAGLPKEEGVRWESEGKGEYTVQNVPKKSRGTEIVLHLREDEDEFLEDYRLRAVVHHYSDHITVPIMMPKSGEGATGEERVNSAQALWTRGKQDISQEEYDEFYKHVAHDAEPPLAHVHSRVEGKLEYSLLLYIPARAPFDLWDRDVRRGVKLYVRRVFIMDDAEQLMPAYLRFVRGVVDSNDLPLNISREILQHNKAIDTIRSTAVTKILGLLEDMASKDPEKYAGFWTQFGRVLKEGLVDDPGNRERIAGLLRFSSTAVQDDAQSVALADYVARAKPEQKAIYFLTADSTTTARNSPHLEVFLKKGIEVLLLTDPIDEWVVMHLHEFEGRPLHSVAKGELDLGELGADEEQGDAEAPAGDFKALLERMGKVLEAKVKEVRVTRRLTTSPACLVAGEHDLGVHLERLLKASGQDIPGSKPILEINPEHPIVRQMNSEIDESRFADWSRILYDQALLSEGAKLEDPAGFVHRLNDMFMTLAGRQKPT